VRRAVAACPFHALRLHRGAKGKALEEAEGDVDSAYPFPISTEGDVFLLGFYSEKNAGTYVPMYVPLNRHPVDTN
jgi:hypothetical protein